MKHFEMLLADYVGEYRIASKFEVLEGKHDDFVRSALGS